MNNKTRALILCLTLTASIGSLNIKAQQVQDSSFRPPIEKPAFAEGKGPVVAIDEAHFNFHTADGRYKPFAELLRRDGYVVKGSKSPFSKNALRDIKILVIANALAERNKEDWSLPTPTAFTDAEIKAVSDWVKTGGSLLLIADHMPFPGAAEKLAAAFGVQFNNGYALDQNRRGGPMTFQLSDGTLKDHAITRGRTDGEKVDSVATFTGSAFKVDKGAEPLLVLGESVVSLMPTVGGQLSRETPSVPVGGWLQGAAMRFGKGRVTIFGEAAMFSAQLAGPNRQPMGMNAPAAAQNPKFLLNILHWLSGLI